MKPWRPLVSGSWDNFSIRKSLLLISASWGISPNIWLIPSSFFCFSGGKNELSRLPWPNLESYSPQKLQWLREGSVSVRLNKHASLSGIIVYWISITSSGERFYTNFPFWGREFFNRNIPVVIHRNNINLSLNIFLMHGLTRNVHL